LDSKANQTEFEKHLSGLSFLWLNHRFDISWGGFEMVRCTLEALKTVVNSEINYTHIALLSGSCMPLLASHDIVDFLKAYPNTTFMDCNPVDCIKEGVDRHALQWYRFGRGRFDLTALPYRHTPYKKAMRVLALFCLRLCVKRELKSFKLVNKAFRNAPRLDQGVDVRIGSQWWVLTRNNAVDIIAFLNWNPWFVEYFEYSKIPDESFFQTLLPFLGQQGHNVTIQPSLTYTSWKDSAPSPEWLDSMTIAERESIVKRGYCFARKFKSSF
jgi:hypothetical protein